MALNSCRTVLNIRWTQVVLRDAFATRRTTPVTCYVKQFTRAKSSTWRPELYILDKYGTMINMHSIWSPWAVQIGRRLESATGLKLEAKILTALDFCTLTKRVRPGLIEDGTTTQIKEQLESVLQGEGVALERAQGLVAEAWEASSLWDDAALEQLRGLDSVLGRIKADGARVAVSTCDVLGVTIEVLDKAGLTSLVDSVVSRGNMSPADRSRHVGDICDSHGASPQKTVVIGDSPSEMLMGRAGDVALTVGVLSGISARLQLHGLADLVAHDLHEAVDMIQTLSQQDVAEFERSRRQNKAVLEARDQRNADLVIFDKDGTLLCFHSLWTPWIEELVEKLEASTGLKDLATKVYPAFGYNEKERVWRPSVFTKGTTQQSVDTLAEVLMSQGMSREDALGHIKDAWHHGDHSTDNVHLRPLDDPTSLFRSLKEAGVKVAVCTSDSRPGTEVFLRDLGAEPYVDLIVCGDDPDSVPKPDAHNGLMICSKLGVDPARALIVGDTEADMGMGRAAKLGATVGVLSGVGDVPHLAPEADYIFPSIGHVLDIVKK